MKLSLGAKLRLSYSGSGHWITAAHGSNVVESYIVGGVGSISLGVKGEEEQWEEAKVNLLAWLKQPW